MLETKTARCNKVHMLSEWNKTIGIEQEFNTEELMKKHYKEKLGDEHQLKRQKEERRSSGDYGRSFCFLTRENHTV